MNPLHGLVIIFSGEGKGKTSIALGMAFRALGNGLRTSMLQFVKQQETGEHRALARMSVPDMEILRLGTGFVLGGSPPAEAVAAAQHGLEIARKKITGGRFDIVILDEIFPALAAGLVTDRQVRDLVDLRPPHEHLVMTGRGAPAWAVERADLVTEMRCIRHPGDRGVEAQPGIEF